MSPDPGPLAPFAPRLAAEWMRDEPDLRHRTIEGTMVFADISGFTRLTERLARQGKEGAELLSDTLDLTFATLLAPAFDDGADLLKWGGDAVLLLFRDEDHAARAARAAHRMRAALRTLVRDRALPVHAPLRMSIGIHSGAFDVFLVGDPASHRELIVTGPAASRLAAVEATCTAGRILLTPETASLLPARVLGESIDVEGRSARLLRSLPEPPIRPGRAAADDAVAGTLPPAIRVHLEAGGGEPEHRPVAVAFVQFGGIDRLIAEEGEDAAATAVHDLVAVVQHACLEHGVTFFESDIAADGGKIMLTAGAPRSAGQDAERMLRTALAIAAHEGALTVRVGVNAGHVFTGELGPAVRRTYSIKGDAVNLAARLLGRAHPGQAVATEFVVAQAHVDVESDALPPFLVKGKKIPVHAVVVREVRGRAAARESRFVGRGEELRLLGDALAAARDGQGSVVDIVGEPGIGKSRLVAELVVPDAVQVFSATSGSYESNTPYSTVGALLRGVLGVGAQDAEADIKTRIQDTVQEAAPRLEPWLALLGVVLDVEIPSTREVDELEERFRRGRIEEITVDLLAALLTDPTLLVFEDTHLMDEASGALLHRLEAESHRHPWCMVLTRREIPVGFVPQLSEPVDLRIALAAIAPESALELLEAAAGGARPSRHTLEAMVERAAGNPLFLTSLAAGARASETSELPDSVEAVLLVDIDRLASSDRALLRLAAVLGARFDPGILVSLTPETVTIEQIAERLDEFVRPVEVPAGAQADAAGLEFRHAMVRDVAYAGLPFRLRRDLHARVATTLEDRDASPELLSLHFHEAGHHDKAWAYSLRAGDDARAKYAYGQAAAFFERALDSAAHLPGIDLARRSAAYLSLGESLDMAGDATGAISALRRARRTRSLGVVETAEVVYKEARITLRLGRYRAALAQLTRALHLLDGMTGAAADAVRARLSIRYGFCLHIQRRDDEAIRWGRRSVEWAEAAGDRELLAHAFNGLHLAYGASTLDEDRPYGQLALSLFEELGDLSGQALTLNNLAIDAYNSGSWNEAIDAFARAAESFHRLGDDANAANALYNHGEMLVTQRRHAEARPVLGTALRLARRVDDEELVGLVLRELARAEAGADGSSTAWPLFDEARTVLTNLDLVGEVALVDAARADALAEAGETAAALALIDATIVEAEVKAAEVLARLYRIRAQALVIEGRNAQAAAAARDGLARTAGTHGGYEPALLRLALADATDDGALRAESRLVLADLGVRA
ncbi:adenylate/guanylate cyclase domain-containing protein [Microbacterium sp. ASV49]|uniref:Adenylate/guanylate cyclase domain-containing protein n=1 Tax=Microbacterium candidum TaxID=3041922 RepID=A0ABT7N2V1_9MICO|nr:adenylate/guanylate cyclase domain-containing protein [Microbacterium sp. ASV49]MDL9981035.1 adenylate/guanylate cyclase domain-containing protein [Microbacterium sp. ASV49]